MLYPSIQHGLLWSMSKLSSTELLKFFSAVAEKILGGTVCSVSIKALRIDRTDYRGLLHREMDAPTAVGYGDGLPRRAG